MVGFSRYSGGLDWLCTWRTFNVIFFGCLDREARYGNFHLYWHFL
jgi:hypothetical protein